MNSDDIQGKFKKWLKPPPTFDSGVFSEPLLLFGGRHEHIDPKTGLSLYGPYTSPDQNIPPLSSIKIGIIGTPPMIADAEHWLDMCRRELCNDGSQPFLHPYFPGFNEKLPFCCQLIYGKMWQETILDQDVKGILGLTNYFARIGKTVELYKKKIETLSQKEPQPDVILCCIPQNVIDECTAYLNKAKEEKRVKVSKAERKALESIAMGQPFLFPEMDPTLGIEEEEFGYQNLRRALKAQAMLFGIPTQIVWPRTLQLVTHAQKASRSPLQDIATRAWNFCTALYYKAGGLPWRLSQIDQTECFIGISFYRETGTGNTKLRTSLAQTFTATGDGYVLRGKTFEWDNAAGASPHLNESSAAAIIRDVLELYQRHNSGSLPTRIIVHKSSKFWDDELKGFQAASKHIPRKDFVAFGSRGIQFYRGGDYPPLRGTYVKFNESNFLLYTSGYVPFLRSYPGARAPMPIEILEHHGDSPWNAILRETIALTKMNWNTADFACSKPITTAFASRVGQIMAEIPENIKPRAEYRFYM